MNRILVVDDEENNLNAVKRVFADLDYTLRFARSGEGALACIREDFDPDVVILDIMMPGIDGYEVCRYLKSNGKTSGIMVLLLSASAGLEDRLKGYEAKADDYMVKPYDPEELKAKVRILLRLKKAHDELRVINQDLENLVTYRTRELVKKERQAIVGQMVQGFIHNLQSPIMVVHNRIEMASLLVGDLQENISGDGTFDSRIAQKINRQLDFSLKAADKVELLIHNLLAKSRRDAAVEKEEIDLNDLIVKELEFLNTDMELKHEVIKTLNLSPSLPSFLGIYSDFSQVVHNMVKNASDAMLNSHQKELNISTVHAHGRVLIRFEDTGPGIPARDLDRIFDPFFTTKPAKGMEKEGEATGTGLGLYTCLQLMKPYGGEISVKSEPGMGTCFIISLPERGE